MPAAPQLRTCSTRGAEAPGQRTAARRLLQRVMPPVPPGLLQWRPVSGVSSVLRSAIPQPARRAVNLLLLTLRPFEKSCGLAVDFSEADHPSTEWRGAP